MKKSKFRVFLLEDDDNDAFLIQRAVERACGGCAVSRFHDPTEIIPFLEALRSPWAEAPDVIISDLKMPRMSGLEFVEWLRASPFSCIPVLMLSGSALAEDVLRAYRHGANSFSTKPVDVHDLDAIVGAVMKYWKEASHTPAALARGEGSLVLENPFGIRE
ncbi:MAG TPA: response regulator [Verrucomicrobiae bacterium]